MRSSRNSTTDPLAALTRLLPLSIRGTLFLIGSLLMIAEGVLRKDLTALYWGGSFLLFLLYTVAGNHLVRSHLSRNLTSESLNLKLPGRGVFPGDSVEVVLKTRLGSPCLPGFAYALETRLRWKSRLPIVINRELKSGDVDEEITVRVRERGRFASRRTSLCIHDYLGFTCSALSVDMVESISVYPNLIPAEDLSYHFEGGSQVKYTEKQTKQDELLEVRKYFPGDDARKLNWKIFAHTGELFIREGEQAPPPASNLLFVLDTAPSPELPACLSDAYMDALVELACSSMLLFLQRNTSLLLSTNGLSKAVSLEREKERRLLDQMASIWWADEGALPPLPEEKNLHLVVFSTPGSSSLLTILERARERGWGTTLIFRDLNLFRELNQSANQVARHEKSLRQVLLPALKFLLFRCVSERPSRQGRQLIRRQERELQTYNDSLRREVSRVRATPWGINDLRIV